MNLRLLPWAAMALLVLVLSFRFALPTDVVAVPAGAPGPETTGGGPEIRLGPVDVRELHDGARGTARTRGGGLRVREQEVSRRA